MRWLFAYSLIGFALSFVCPEIFRVQAPQGWRWELLATALWPLMVLLAIAEFALSRKEKQHDQDSR
jgi:hypothetical protein